jgi:DUF1680 family protein
VTTDYTALTCAHNAAGFHIPATADSATAPVVPQRGTRRGLGVTDVHLDVESFWGARQEVNATATFAHCVAWMERLGWLENFDRIARGERTYARAGWQFSDSEVYKLLEGMAWEHARSADPALVTIFEGLVARVAAAQDADGYLSTAFGHPGLPPRYSDMSMGHELYNVGHLLQAAVACMRTGIGQHLVSIAHRAADHVCDTFAPGANESLCGHPEIEVALVEFGRATGEVRYLEQARVFIDRRGRGILPVRPLLSAEYFQDDTPVRDAVVLRGHAVRALYLSAGAVDLAVDSADHDLLDALRRQWQRTVERRTYVTGGMGSRHQDEGFGEDWELPADRAYCETCAGVASIMFSWRLYLATGEVAYADLIERTLFNIVATSPAADGRSFFYANPLHQREMATQAHDGVNHRAEGGSRAPWFDVSCCPTNVARTLASLGAYLGSADADALTLAQYAAGTITAQLTSGLVTVRVDTRYPADGHIRVTVVQAPAASVTLRLRVPSWAHEATLTGADGVRVPCAPGWVDITADFAAGDIVELDLSMTPRLTWPDPRIDAVRGTAAVERGPLVLCVESTDLPEGVDLDDIRLNAGATPVAHGDGARISAGIIATPSQPASAPPFGVHRDVPLVHEPLDLPLVPYHRWAERGPSRMRVFLPIEVDRT